MNSTFISLFTKKDRIGQLKLRTSTLLVWFLVLQDHKKSFSLQAE